MNLSRDVPVFIEISCSFPYPAAIFRLTKKKALPSLRLLRAVIAITPCSITPVLGFV
jgi:hypothetical protein